MAVLQVLIGVLLEVILMVMVMAMTVMVKMGGGTARKLRLLLPLLAHSCMRPGCMEKEVLGLLLLLVLVHLVLSGQVGLDSRLGRT